MMTADYHGWKQVYGMYSIVWPEQKQVICIDENVFNGSRKKYTKGNLKGKNKKILFPFEFFKVLH